MLLSVLLWALACAFEESKSLVASTNAFVLPWEIKAIEADGDCPQLCGNWSALYLSDNGCKGGNMALLNDGETGRRKIVVTGGTLRFCPDKESVEAWTIEKEEDYAAMYLSRDELLEQELMTFERITLERKIKLSVHPWKKFPTQEIRDLMERRRIKGKSGKFTCVGSQSGDTERHNEGTRPEKIAVQYGTVIDHLEIYYPSQSIQVGTEDGGDTYKKKLPDCVSVVLLKSDGDSISGIELFSHDKTTKLLGKDEEDSYLIVAPSGKCLGDMKIRGDDVVNRICMKFNVDE